MQKRKAKTRKSIIKRFKFTKSGKILHRSAGQDHYRTKRTGKQRRAMRGWTKLSSPDAKKIKKLLKS
ncbi:MAG: 50S ribosomal protein L35 [Candidatus Wildermuthbacteria bacterium RIFCSPHIGHO2_02_FULL_49_9]|uniref:Large ribosomal subunit protein bL35 n=2 Tax=Candidatus Wildermuthiibacteriota TaxID=1817923 RepID=A0A1G2QZI4_9BACT|nr:MAG: 50S ribosomal protein L35 [Candidatus Wildermuthbacteria bacterium RIFCSPHIGHO2_01_FULL_49_22b]OHA70540.1 MAG: 50S ribosomal protein L35 [Candidatus Wildermuthbacteria bacterium RIFCSPHIGHO2_02_FULL_49_9]